MALPETYRCEAITLSYTPLGEADLLVTMYTRDQGKVRAVAKGARRSTSKLLGHLEPLTVVRMSMVHGRSMDIIAKAEVLQSFAALKEDLTGIAEGLYLAELVDVFGAEGSANPSLFQLIVDTLRAVEADPGSDMPLRFFEFHLLQVSPWRMYGRREQLLSRTRGNRGWRQPHFGSELGNTGTPSKLVN